MVTQTDTRNDTDESVWIPAANGRTVQMDQGEADTISGMVLLFDSVNRVQPGCEAARELLVRIMEWAVNKQGLDLYAVDLPYIRDWRRAQCEPVTVATSK